MADEPSDHLPDESHDPYSTPYDDSYLDVYGEVDGRAVPSDPWAEDEGPIPVSERLDLWRRRYLPLPDETVYEFLGEDEYVIHTDRQPLREALIGSWVRVLWAALASGMFVAAGERFRGGWTSPTIAAAGGLVVFTLPLLALLVRTLYTRFVITNLRILTCRGLLSREVRSLPWRLVIGVSLRQTGNRPSRRRAVIFIGSAGKRSGLHKISGLIDPLFFFDRLLEGAAGARGGRGFSSASPPTRAERRAPHRTQRWSAQGRS